MIRRKLIGGGILLAAVGYTGFKVVEFLADRVKEESRKIEEEKLQSEDTDAEETPDTENEEPEEAYDDLQPAGA